MTKQEIFNQAVRGLAKQGFERSYESKGGIFGVCQYRDSNGRKCAAGHLLKNKDYLPDMEGTQASADSVRKALRRSSGILARQIPFVTDVQKAHDNGFTPEEMKRLLREVAEEHKLRIPRSIKVSA